MTPFSVDARSLCTAGDPSPMHFTGQERDSETGNDNFKARYYSSGMGRFLSPDPSGIWLANLGDPQQLNMYSYVRNNPLSFVDPTGLDCTFLNSASGAIMDSDATADAFDCSLSGGFWTSGPVNQVSQNINGTYQFGWSGTLANGDLSSITYNSYIGPNIIQSLLEGSPLGSGLVGQSLLDSPPASSPTAPSQPTPFSHLCPPGTTTTNQNMLVTGYDNSFQSTGKNPGDPGYGLTASGSVAANGTIAAPRIYPFGTQMYVPGYGLGTVQDRGGAIRNAHIDVWFPKKQQAINWGAQNLQVTVCQ